MEFSFFPIYGHFLSKKKQVGPASLFQPVTQSAGMEGGEGVYFIDWSIAAKRTGRRLRFNGITTAIVSGTINQKKTKQKSPKRSATAGATGQHETCCFAHDPGVVFEGDWNERPVATFRQLSPALLLTSILLIDRSLIFRLVVKLDQIIAHRKMGPRRLLPLGQILFDRYTPFFIFPPPP
jgi:hypothetical protein